MVGGPKVEVPLWASSMISLPKPMSKCRVAISDLAKKSAITRGVNAIPNLLFGANLLRKIINIIYLWDISTELGQPGEKYQTLCCAM